MRQSQEKWEVIQRQSVTNMNANLRAHTKERGDHGWAPLVVDYANNKMSYSASLHSEP